MTFKEREGDEQRWNGRPGRRACGCRRKPRSLLGSLALLRGSLAPCACVLGFQQCGILYPGTALPAVTENVLILLCDSAVTPRGPELHAEAGRGL